MSSRRSLLSFFAFASLILATGDAWAQGTRQERLFAAIPGTATTGSSRLVEIDTSIEAFGSILSSTPDFGAFDIEAGSAPGLANLMSRSVGGTTFTVDGVPSGHYYVRVRAINDVGRSVPTSDIEVIVP